MELLKKYRYAVLAPPIALVLFYLLATTNVFQKLEYLSVDWRYALRYKSDPKPHKDLMVVGIDEPCLEEFGRWPWDRNIHGLFLELLKDKRPKSIAFDFLFTEPDEMIFDDKFGKEMIGLNAVITGAKSQEKEGNFYKDYFSIKSSQNYMELVDAIFEKKKAIKKYFYYDQLYDKEVDNDESKVDSIYENIDGAFGSIKEIDNEDDAKEMAVGLVGFLCELAKNLEIKQYSSKLENVENFDDAKNIISSFFIDYFNPIGIFNKTKSITNIIGDKSKIDGQTFALYPERANVCPLSSKRTHKTWLYWIC